MEPNEIDIARKLLFETLNNDDKFSVSAKRFRAQNHENIKVIDKLEQTGFILRENQQYTLALKTLLLLSDHDSTAERLLGRCDTIFEFLKSNYIKSYELSPNGGGSVLVGTIVRVLSIDIADYVEVFPYLEHSPIISSSHGAQDDITSSIIPDESIIRYKSFSDLIRAISHFDNRTTDVLTSDVHLNTKNEINKALYISLARIDALRSFNNSHFDFARLIKICEELNFNYENQNYLSVSVLLRMLIDHIPPIFNQPNFKAVIANWNGRSQQELFKKLEECKAISNIVVHAQISAKEILPNEQQVHFQHAIDTLIGEVIKVCGN